MRPARRINAGTLLLMNQYAIGTNSTFVGGPAGQLVFDQSVTGNAFDFGGLAEPTSIELDNNAPAPIALTVGANGQTTTYSGSLYGSGGLTKVGSGVLTLTGSNNYLGNTNINGGYVVAAGTESLPGWNSPNLVKVNSGIIAVQLGGDWTPTAVNTLFSNAQFTNNASGWGIDTSNGNQAWSTPIQNFGTVTQAFAKLGPNTLTLTVPGWTQQLYRPNLRPGRHAYAPHHQLVLRLRQPNDQRQQRGYAGRPDGFELDRQRHSPVSSLFNKATFQGSPSNGTTSCIWNGGYIGIDTTGGNFTYDGTVATFLNLGGTPSNPQIKYVGLNKLGTGNLVLNNTTANRDYFGGNILISNGTLTCN